MKSIIYSKRCNRIPLLLFFMFCIPSCVYFNTFYNAEVAFKDAKRLIDSMDFRETSIPSQAKTLLDEAILSSRVVINQYPNSRFVEDAYYIISISMFLKEDYKGAQNHLNKLIDLFPNGKSKVEAYLWLSYCELKLDNSNNSQKILNKTIVENKLNKDESYLSNIIFAELFLERGEFSNAYEKYKEAIEYSSTDVEKIKIYNQLIKISDKNEDYINLVEFLDDIYPFLRTIKEKKEIKLLSIKYNKELENFEYVILEIEGMLNQSIFNDIRIKLFSELGKVYFEMDRYYAAKEIFEELISSYSKKDETAEAYYYLAKINLKNDFSLELIKEFLNTSKTEKSSSKHGKLSKILLNRIDDLESSLDEYNYLIDNKLSDSIEVQISDSLLFNIAQIYHFDFNQIDSAISRYDELLSRFPESKFRLQSILILSQLDSANTNWNNHTIENQMDEINLEESNEELQFKEAFTYLDKGEYNQSYDILKKIYEDTNDKKILFHLGYIDEYHKSDIKNMLNHYIDFLNEYNHHDNALIVKDKLSSYYYILNHEIKSLYLKSFLLKCNKMIKDSLAYNMIFDCYENIDDQLLFYSEDSLKLKITNLNILNKGYSKFKKELSFIDSKYETLYKDYTLFYETIQSADSTAINFQDSTTNLIDFYLQLDDIQIQEDINEISDYLSIFNNLSIGENDIETLDEKESRPGMNFENLNIEEMDLEKLKLLK